MDESIMKKHVDQVHDSVHGQRTFSSKTRSQQKNKKEVPSQKETAPSILPKSEETPKDTEPYYCNSCDYESMDESLMKTHVEKHGSSAPFSCTDCHEFFAAKDQFDLHNQFYHGNSDKQ